MPLIVGSLFLVLWAWVISEVVVPLALTRHFHVDEIQVAYNAALLGLHGLPDYLNYLAPFLVPLSWIAARGGETWPLLLEMRAVFLVVFLLDLALVAFFAPRVRGFAATMGTLLAVTLVEPFWRHGFEIRHDGLMLAASLGLFAFAQRAVRGRAGLYTFFASGLLAGWMQLNSFKALVVWPVALLLVLVAGRWGGSSTGLARAVTAIGVGFATGVAMGFGLLAWGTIADDFVGRLALVGHHVATADRFSAGSRLVSILAELPHLSLLALVALLRLIVRLRRGQWRAEGSSFVTVAWLLLALLALAANPAPYTYNLVHFIPFLFLAAVDGFGALWGLLETRGRVVLGGLAAASCLLSFAYSSTRVFIDHVSGAAQRDHIEAAESLTTTDDPVLDAAGLVLSRRPPSRDWMLHSLFMQDYLSGRREKFRDLLRSDPAPVLITNYRWKWLDREDVEFIRSRYIGITERLLVLGGPLRERQPIYRTGRYAVYSVTDDPITIDGVESPSGGVVELERGEHFVEHASAEAFLAWVGPELERVPEALALLPGGDLFISD